MKRDEFYARFAAVVANVGLGIESGQEVYVRSPIETAAFVPYFVREAYKRGARYVHVDYRDQASIRARLEAAPVESLGYVPPGVYSERLRVGTAGGASLAILGEDPMGLAGVDPVRRGAYTKALAEAGSGVRDLAMKDHHPWCVISIPNPTWAARVYPDLPADRALDQLFDAVAHACRLDCDDPVAAWSEHSRRLMRLAAWLTEQAFDSFHYASPGTDLVVGMPANQHWIGTEGTSTGGISFVANIPTDEVFCAPDRLRVDGTLRSTRPLILGGTNVGIAEFTVKAGRIVEAHCERDEAVLLQELDLDERARFFGEIALVSEDAPIAQTRTVFYDGLYDENAGCHVAFGSAYANCVAGGAQMDEEARLAAGLNQSNQHVDVTIGSPALSITAIRADGTEFPLMRAGRWTEKTVSAAGL